MQHFLLFNQDIFLKSALMRPKNRPVGNSICPPPGVVWRQTANTQYYSTLLENFELVCPLTALPPCPNIQSRGKLSPGAG